MQHIKGVAHWNTQHVTIQGNSWKQFHHLGVGGATSMTPELFIREAYESAKKSK